MSKIDNSGSNIESKDMMVAASNNICSICGGRDKFIVENGKLKCLYCGSTFNIKIESSSSGSSSGGSSSGSSSESSSGSNNNESIKKNSLIFSNNNWKTLLQNIKEKYKNYGIILTNTSVLENSAKEKLLNALESYIDFRSAEGVHYVILDLATQKVSENKNVDIVNIVDNILSTIYKVAIPKYIMIVGDSKVVPKMEWTNECRTAFDHDANVPSDLCYIACNTKSPFKYKYNFNNVTAVGRVLGSIANGMQESITYFNNTKTYKPVDVTQLNPYVMTAAAWVNTTKNDINGFADKILVSPPMALPGVPNTTPISVIPDSCRLVVLNLHGSEIGYYYFGQGDGNNKSYFCRAFSPDFLPKHSKWFVMITSACYGAKGDEYNSTVSTAQRNYCIDFLGSSRISYGSANPEYLTCSDVITRTFITSLHANKTAGQSFIDALKAIYSNGDNLNMHNAKTIAEFALYGDPSIIPYVNKSVHTKGIMDDEVLVKCSIEEEEVETLIECNTPNDFISDEDYCAKGGIFDSVFSVTESVMNIVKSVLKSSEKFIKDFFKDLISVKPKTYRIKGRDEYVVSYCKETDDFVQIVDIWMDKNGNIKQSYESK